MANFITVHGIHPESAEKFIFYVDADTIEAIIPADKAQQELGYKSTLIVKNSERGYDVTETITSLIKKLRKNTDETETE